MRMNVTAPRDRYKLWLAPASIFATALLLYSINLDRPPHPDELHHALAAQHLMDTGHPTIANGEYRRGILHTWMVALSYEAFGESIASARLPAVFFVALVAPLVFVWVRREANILAAWIASFLFLTSPLAVEIAQFSRFYALQVFSFTAGAMCTYYAFIGEKAAWRAIVLLTAAFGLFALAVWLQITTFMGLVGVTAWVAGLFAVRYLPSPGQGRSIRNRRLVAGLLLAMAFVAMAFMNQDKLQWAVERYRYAPLFASKSVDEFWYYHVRYFLLYPTLWTLIGVLAIAAVIRSARIAWMAMSVFGISFLLASCAGQKEMRYFSFAQPFLAILWGLGLAYVVPAVSSVLQSSRERFRASLPFASVTAETMSRAFAFLALGILVVMNPFWLRTAAIIGNVALPMEKPTTDWREARAVLAPWFSGSGIVITTEELGAIYFLGRSDVRFSPSKLGEVSSDQRFEFGIDRRVGLPVISRPESLKQLMMCFSSGIIVGPIEHWGNPNLISEQVQAVIRAHARPIEVPNKSHLYAWGWARQGAGERQGHCAELELFSGLPESH